jgi:ABC-type Mn2+/Zn2+ transport system permease subunit
MNSVGRSVLWTLTIIGVICSLIYFVFWEQFKRFIVNETLLTLSSKDYWIEAVQQIISNPNGFFQAKKI